MSNNAFVTLTSNDLFVPGAIAAVKSIRMTKTKHPIFCMVSNEVSEENKIELENNGCTVIVVDKIHSNVSGEEGDRFEVGKNWLTFTKLNVFNLTQFDKIVYIDADCIVLQNIDDMFNFPTLSGYTLAHTGELEAGVLVLEPSNQLFNEILSFIDKENWKNHDQSLLNWFFRDHKKEFHHLSNEYHFCHKLYHNRDPSLLQKKKAKIIEFNGYKPWIPSRWKDGEDVFYKIWNYAYSYEF
tara:strand:- start:1552 stop:2271 length:720 start_codon:yes stop_codon:yes gene_type:complete